MPRVYVHTVPSVVTSKATHPQRHNMVFDSTVCLELGRTRQCLRLLFSVSGCNKHTARTLLKKEQPSLNCGWCSCGANSGHLTSPIGSAF
jgi:hypothetical protein